MLAQDKKTAVCLQSRGQVASAPSSNTNAKKGE
jgi:hypothetical protein